MEGKKNNSCLKRYIIVVFEHLNVHFSAAGLDINPPIKDGLIEVQRVSHKAPRSEPQVLTLHWGYF